MSVRFVTYEGAKMCRRGFIEYFASSWNLLALGICTSLLFIVCFEFSSGNDGIARKLAASVTPFVWLQSFHYLRGFRGTGALVRMMIQILIDIKYFSLIMIIMTIAFSQSFFILQEE